MNTNEFIDFLATGIESAEVYDTDEHEAVLIFFTLSDGREVYVEIK